MLQHSDDWPDISQLAVRIHAREAAIGAACAMTPGEVRARLALLIATALAGCAERLDRRHALRS